MRTSQLIERLQATLAEHGDLEVYLTEFTPYPRRLFGLASATNGAAPSCVTVVQLYVVLA